MGITEIIALITGLLQFPGIILQFIKILKSTPQQSHEALLAKIAEESKAFQDTGRPTW